MSDSRKNLKISEGTYELLTEDKRDYETWNGYFRRKLDVDD